MNNLKSGIIIFTTSKNLFGKAQHVIEGGISTHVSTLYYSHKNHRYEVMEQSWKTISTDAVEWIAINARHICGIGDMNLDTAQQIKYDFSCEQILSEVHWYDMGVLFGFLFRPLRRWGKADKFTCVEAVLRAVMLTHVLNEKFPGIDQAVPSPADMERYLGKTIERRTLAWLTK